MWIVLAALGGVALSIFYLRSYELTRTYGHEFLVFAMGVVLIPFGLWGMDRMDNVYELLVVLGGILYGFSLTLFYVALKHLNVLVVSVIVALMPAFIIILGWIVLGHSLTGNQAAAIVCMLFGTSVVVANTNGGSKSSLWGLVIMSISIMMTSSYNLLIKYARVADQIPGFDLFLFVRFGVMVSVIVLLMTKMRKKMVSLFRLEWNIQRRFYINEFFFLVFSVLFLFSVTSLKDEYNVGMVSVVYLGVLQVCVFATSAWKKQESNIVRKLIGASITFTGLIYLVSQK